MLRLNRLWQHAPKASRSFSANARAVSSQPWGDYLSTVSATDPLHRLLKSQGYINGRWTDAVDGQTFEVRDPASLEVLATLPDMGVSETNEAIIAASASLSAWQSLNPHQRSEIVHKIYVLMNVYQEQLARLITAECGKPLGEARGEVLYAASFFKWFAEEGRRLDGDVLAPNKAGRRLLVTREPVGVCGIITPWNFPSAMIARKLAPALVTGCSAVIKPPSETPLSALAMAEICEEAGVLPGVVSIIPSARNFRSVGQELCENKIVRKISFTGSTSVGMTLAQQCSTTLKRTSMELGGNAPFIVFADADIPSAIQGAMASKFRNSGQTCVCTNRFYVAKKVYDEFTEGLAKEVAALNVGHGFGDGVSQGPLISEKGVSKVKRHVDDAREKGAEVVCGGKAVSVDGMAGSTFYAPTVLHGVTSAMECSKEETFGPVASLMAFEDGDEAEVVRMANDTDAGLAAYFYTKDLSRAFRVSEQLQYGMVGVNSGLISTEIAPFGGVKYSGMGREGGRVGVDEYVNLKYTCIEGV